MRRFIKTLALMAVAVVGAVSCTKDIASNNINLATKGVTLYANTPKENLSTKVGFEDKDSEGIALSWEDGDSFKLYNSNDELVDTFTTTGDGKFTSSNVETKLVEGKKYTAKYNEGADSAEQNGDDIQNLNAACQMEATFTYGDSSDEPIMFAHTKAIMTFTFKSEVRPAYLIFKNGEEEYKVTYSELAPVNGIYTSHIMIDPCDGTPRELKFTLYDNTDTPYDVRTVESSKPYEKGYRYTAPISDIVKFSGGAGTVGDPYKISNRADFDELSAYTNGGTYYEGKFFVMTNDVDLGGESNEFTAITFDGTFDGAGHAITGLYINQPEQDGQALFSSTYSATIKNLSVSGSVTGKNIVGGVIGMNQSSTVANCYSNVEVSGTGNVGGVVGDNINSTVANCYSSGKVSGTEYVGGVVGDNYGSTVANCYSNVEVSGTGNVGGVVGNNYGTATNCYWNSTVNSDSEFKGVGDGTDTTTPMTTAEMQSFTFNKLLNNNAYAHNSAEITPAVRACSWDWTSGYPTLDFDGVPTFMKFSGGAGTEIDPYKISNRADFDELSANVNSGTHYKEKFFVMTNDVELGGESNEFTAIGNIDNQFKGTFDGTGHAITGLYINDDGLNLGLFGDTDGATIKNLSVSGSVTSTYSGDQGNVGGVVGWADHTTITNCYNSCSLSLMGSNGSYIGGVAGVANSSSTITNCHNSGSLEGGSTTYIGGVAGYAYSSTITNCYNSGSHDGGVEVGGVVDCSINSTITNCYWDEEKFTDGIGYHEITTMNGDLEGMTTADMQSDTFQTTLNSNAATYNGGTPAVKACAWGWESGKYPYLTFLELAD